MRGVLSEIDNLCIEDCLTVSRDIYTRLLQTYEGTEGPKKQIVIIGPGSSPSYYCYCMKNLQNYDEDKVKVLVLPFTLSYKITCPRPDDEQDAQGNPFHSEPGGDLSFNLRDLEEGFSRCRSCNHMYVLEGKFKSLIAREFISCVDVYHKLLIGKGIDLDNKEVHIIDYVDTGESMEFLKKIVSRFEEVEIHPCPLVSLDGRYIGRQYVLPVKPNSNNINAPSVIHVKYEFPRIVVKYPINYFDIKTFNPDVFQNLEGNEIISSINDKLFPTASKR